MDNQLTKTEALLLLILAEVKRANSEAIDQQRLTGKAALTAAAVALEQYLDIQAS